MALESIVIYSADVPVLDLKGTVLQSENHTAENEVVEQVLENGSPMTDHIIIKPDIVEISFIVTNIDLNATTDAFGSENAKTVWNELKRLRNTRTLIDVVTTHENYTSMAIESLSSSHETPFKGQLKYNIKLKKVNLTNFNVGSNTTDKYIGKNGKETNPNANISKSATDENDYGYSPADTNSTNPSAVKSVVDKYVEKNYGDLLSIANETYTIATEVYTTGKDTLTVAANVVKVNDDEVFEITTNINGTTVKFRIYYNEKLGCWMMDIINSDGTVNMSGIILFYDTNLVEGLDNDLPTNNLFVSEIIKEAGKTNRYIYWFDETDFSTFKTLADGLYALRSLNFDINEMDYNVTVEPIS